MFEDKFSKLTPKIYEQKVSKSTEWRISSNIHQIASKFL